MVGKSEKYFNIVPCNAVTLRLKAHKAFVTGIILHQAHLLTNETSCIITRQFLLHRKESNIIYSVLCKKL